MKDLQLIKREDHCYGQSEYSLSRPLTLQDVLPKWNLDPTKSYRVVNGVFEEIGEHNANTI